MTGSMPLNHRPALATTRTDQRHGPVGAHKLKTAWRDGTTHLVMSPLEFMQRHIDGQLCVIEFCERYVSIGVGCDRSSRRAADIRFTSAPVGGGRG